VTKASKWVFIHKYLKWNAFENGNVAEAARKAFDQVPSIALKALLAAALLEFGCHLRDGFVAQLETLVKPFANPEPEPEPNPEPEPIRNQNQPNPFSPHLLRRMPRAREKVRSRQNAEAARHGSALGGIPLGVLRPLQRGPGAKPDGERATRQGRGKARGRGSAGRRRVLRWLAAPLLRRRRAFGRPAAARRREVAHAMGHGPQVTRRRPSRPTRRRPTFNAFGSLLAEAESKERYMPSRELIEAVAVTAELCGRTFSEAAARVFVSDLSAVSGVAGDRGTWGAAGARSRAC
jgi:hypothetical protein